MAFANSLFDDEPAGAFSHGMVFMLEPDLGSLRENPRNGYWHCDIAHDEKLTWTEKVYELFGVPNGQPIERNWAVGRYSEPSRHALEKIRPFALSHKCGFILDAAIKGEDAKECWIRVLAYPVLRKGRVVGLHGLKRAL